MSRKTKAAGRIGGAEDGGAASAPKRAKKEKLTITKSDVGTLDVGALVGNATAEIPSEASESSLTSPSAVVDSTPSSPDASATTAMTSPEQKSIQKETQMDFTLVRGNVSKSGKKITFSNPALVRGLVFPVAVFGETGAPESLTLSGVGFKTRNADEQAKAEARNAKRIAKGQKPKATPQERALQLEARAAKLQAKLERAQKASAKLAAKLGTVAPATTETASEAPATV